MIRCCCCDHIPYARSQLHGIDPEVRLALAGDRPAMISIYHQIIKTLLESIKDFHRRGTILNGQFSLTRHDAECIGPEKGTTKVPYRLSHRHEMGGRKNNRAENSPKTAPSQTLKSRFLVPMATITPSIMRLARTVERAGGSCGKKSPYTRLRAAKSRGSARQTVHLTTSVRSQPASARAALTLSSACLACGSIPPATSRPSGPNGTWPET